MHLRMFGIIFIFICPVIFLGANSQDLTCSKSLGSSCAAITPLVSGPTCPVGFDLVEEHCFKVSDDMVFWNESKDKCEELNAKLAEPRELLNSTEFLNYIYQHVDELDNSTYDYYEYGDWFDRVFSLGGKFTNNSWEWLTGGNITNSYVYGTGCLAVRIYDKKDYEYELSRSMAFKDITFYLFSIPCNSSDFYAYESFRYVCQAEPENINYSPCVQNGQEYASGELVSMNEQQCQQSWCEAGVIKQYTCGNITSSCCEYNGMLYGNGDIIGPEVATGDCAGCKQRVCQAGAVQWQECTNCSVKCCFFNGASYQPGNYIPNSCARLVCDGISGEFRNLGIDYDCPKCKAYLDPHIVTYDQKWSSYSYQGCGNYSLSQVGRTYQPALAVYANFEHCGGESSTVTCVGDVTFKNDEHTVVAFRYVEDESRIEIRINGEDIEMDPSSSPTIVQAMGTAYPVMAWKSSNCVNLQGSSGILVRFCASSWTNQVYVWAHPDVAGDLEGLCGSVNDDVDDDFQTREGNVTSPWQRNPRVEFPLSWLTTSTSNGSCDGGQVRAKRQTQPQNECDSSSSVLEGFRSQCKDAIFGGFSNAEPQEVQTIIDDCVYDLCNVSNPDVWINAVEETALVQAEIQENTQNFSMTTTTLAPTTTEQSTTVPTSSTVEPSTTTPNTTMDCNCKRGCWKKSGFCTNEPETCDGRVKERGCKGTNCVCCIPDECRPKKKCYRRGGFCISSEETCDGDTTTGCWGDDCVCCLKKDRCNPKKKCWKKGGVCVTDPNICKGKIIEDGCQTENCFCCVNQPKC